MNKRQKIIIVKLAVVVAVTVLAAIVLMNLKAAGLRRGAMRAMTSLSAEIMKYKKNNISLPPEEYLDRLMRDMRIQGLLGNFHYRALWITADSNDREILAYTETDYHSMLDKRDCLVIRLDGAVEWMDKGEFYALLESQQGPIEKQTIKLGE